jgi:nucleoside-diphosphate-sugar epimerase
MKVLLTGIDGYIGTVLGQQLIKSGYDVVGLDTGYYAEAWLYDLPDFKKPNVIIKDIRDIKKEDLEGFDAVVHLAELSNDPVGENDPEITYQINHEGTKNLAKLAKDAGVKRFIYFSSCSVYGASDEVLDEESSLNPLTAYAKSKALNEKYLLSIADENFSPIIFRNATVYGPSPRFRFDLAVNNLSGLAFTTKEIKMDSDGTPWRPFVHILDVCQAVEIALETPLDRIHKQIVNVGDTNSNYQIKDIAEIVRKTFPESTVTLNKNGADKRNYRVNFDKIKKVLPGFSCKYDIAKGAEELREIFTKINLTAEEFQSRDYIRLKQIKYLRENSRIDNSFFWSK